MLISLPKKPVTKSEFCTIIRDFMTHMPIEKDDDRIVLKRWVENLIVDEKEEGSKISYFTEQVIPVLAAMCSR